VRAAGRGGVGAAGGLRSGEIILRDATRSFDVRADPARTLKGALLGRRQGGRGGGRDPVSVPALRGVTLSIAPGETVGMVGRNGAGKTSTLRVLAGIVPLHSGQAACGGRVVSLLELAAGFSRDFSGRENIYLQGALYGLRKADIEQRIERIIAFSELDDFIDIAVKTYSAGMFVRLGFSIAAHLDADVLLVDEVLAVGDEAFQRKCLRRISAQIAAGATVVLVSHDAAAIERVCERVVVMEAGCVMFDGPTAEGLLFYHRLMGVERGAGESVRGRTGPNSRPVEVTDVELRDAAGRPATVFRSGAPMRIVLAVQGHESLSEARLTLELRGGVGLRLFATETELALDGAGGAAMVFEIPALTLLGGDYDLVLSAGGLDHPDRTVRFSVVSESAAQGVVDLGGTWQPLAAVREPS
jgi:ABC-type polysaccharide/polyol phosphate transport system ATPase subunit